MQDERATLWTGEYKTAQKQHMEERKQRTQHISETTAGKEKAKKVQAIGGQSC